MDNSPDCDSICIPPDTGDSGERHASLNYVPLAKWNKQSEKELVREQKRAEKLKISRMKRLEKIRKEKIKRIEQFYDSILLSSLYCADFLFYLVVSFFLFWALEYTSSHDSWLSEALDDLLETVFR